MSNLTVSLPLENKLPKQLKSWLSVTTSDENTWGQWKVFIRIRMVFHKDPFVLLKQCLWALNLVLKKERQKKKEKMKTTDYAAFQKVKADNIYSF